MPTVKYFSFVRERLGISEEEIDFEGTVKDLKDFLAERHPELKEVIDSLRIAVNEEYASENTQIKGGDRVAIIPPVSGG